MSSINLKKNQAMNFYSQNLCRRVILTLFENTTLYLSPCSISLEKRIEKYKFYSSLEMVKTLEDYKHLNADMYIKFFDEQNYEIYNHNQGPDLKPLPPLVILNYYILRDEELEFLLCSESVNEVIQKIQILINESFGGMRPVFLRYNNNSNEFSLYGEEVSI